MADVDILCVVDGQSLYEHLTVNSISNSPTNRFLLYDNPSGGDSPRFNIEKYCRMITRDGSAEVVPNRHGGLTSNAHNDLTIRARVGDIIRWRAVSLTADEMTDGFRVDIHGFHPMDHSLCDQPTRPHAEVDMWQTVARGPGRGSYYLDFDVLAWDGTTHYFYWDPGIHIVEK